MTDRALGSYLGLAIGDALGGTVEFLTAREIACFYGVHKELTGGGWLHLKPGQVTDDTEMSLWLGKAILAHPEWNLTAVADAYAGWMHSRPIDIGNTCRRGIRRYMQYGSLVSAPCDHEAGNGAAMRNLPVVLANLDDESAMIARSLDQARVTHNNPLSDAAVVALARMTRLLINGGSLTDCSLLADELVNEHPRFRFRPWPKRCSGFIVDTMQTVLDAFFHSDNFEDSVVIAVNRGGDADTIGALAGQLAGALYGANAIPARWLKRLDPEVHRSVVNQTIALLAHGETVSRSHPDLQRIS